MNDLVEATPVHAAALAEIHRAAFPERQAWSAEAMRLQLTLTGAFGLIDQDGGMVLARVAADEAEILTIAVVPATRRRGLGRRLLVGAMRRAGTLGARVMFLEVAVGNAPARALYAGLGFIQVGRRAGYYAASNDALVLRAELGKPPARA